MRLMELEIWDVRGVRHLLLEPQGRSIVLYGPNGSGKSAVVDALDFLLTGQVSRLTGSGTGGASLKEHGPHIDSEPAKARVRARLSLDGVDRVVELRRRMSRPDSIDCRPEDLQLLEPILRRARHRTHTLTRRDILRYITVEPKNRASAIQAVLNLSGIQETRDSLVKARNLLDSDRKQAANLCAAAERMVATTAGLARYDGTAVLAVANRDRAVLGGGPRPALASDTIQDGLDAPSVLEAQPEARASPAAQADFDSARRMKDWRYQEALGDEYQELRRLVAELRSDPESLKAVDTLGLMERGVELIGVDGACPLCGRSWPSGELQEHLQSKIRGAQTAKAARDRVMQLATGIRVAAQAGQRSLKRIAEAAGNAGMGAEASTFSDWLRDLTALGDALSDPLRDRVDEVYSASAVRRMLAPPEMLRPLRRVQHAVLRAPTAVDPKRAAWDRLTRLSEDLTGLEGAQEALRLADASFALGDQLVKEYELARDATLSDLYARAETRFAALYARLHGNDEASFGARLTPTAAGMGLEVDFYGRGYHPPSALHSEGHQDSMGLCLYLALAELLTDPVIDLLVLDDVVMSVDAGHRRGICDVIRDDFGSRQFLVTTHDTAWAQQLRASGVVPADLMIHLSGWSVDTGPRAVHAGGFWEEVAQALADGDAHEAAWRLRRGLEQYFELMCEYLGASVPYRADRRWDLGDLAPAVISRYRQLLRMAKSSAQSWGAGDDMATLQELDAVFGQIATRTQAEQWAVNASVHYNSWLQLSPGDLEPIRTAFHDLEAALCCTACGKPLYVQPTRGTPEMLRCPCGRVSWNLFKRPREPRT